MISQIVVAYKNRSLSDPTTIPVDSKQSFEALFALSLLDLIPSPRRSRISVSRDPESVFQKLVNLPEETFFEQFRMSREGFHTLCERVAPFFQRELSKRGPKPAPFIFMLLFTVRLLAQGLHSWAAFSIDHEIGKATLMNEWVPNVCISIILACPLPKRRTRDDDGWQTVSEAFQDLAKRRVLNDLLSGVKWRERLPTVWRPLLPIGEVFDGLQTPLRERPRGLGPRVQEYIHYKTNRYSLNNLVGVDSRGRITTALIGAPGSVADSRLFEQLKLFKSMESSRTPAPANDYRIPRDYKVLADSGFKLRTWVLTPYTMPAIMKASNPYACRVYNFRLSQIRVVYENCFGRVKGRWTVLRDLPYGPESAALVVHSCFCLHNFLEERNVPLRRAWLDELTELDTMSTDFNTVTAASPTSATAAKAAREMIVKEFM